MPFAGKRKYYGSTFSRAKRGRFARRNYMNAFKRRGRFRRRRVPFRKYRAGNLHNWRRVEFESNVQVTTSAVNGQVTDAVAFRLSDVTGYADLTALFDTYRIRAIKFELIPIVNVYEGTDTQPMLCLAVDRDDESVPANIENMLQRSGSKIVPFNRTVSKYFTPCTSGAQFVSTLSTGYAQNYREWITAATADVKYYGIKYGFQAAPSQTVTFNQRVTYYIQTKQPIRR